MIQLTKLHENNFHYVGLFKRIYLLLDLILKII